jgi:Tol biopolymer transport system component
MADWIAPILALAGLVLIGWITLGLLTGNLPIPGARGPGGVGPAGNRTPAPSNVVIVDPRADVPGSLVYVKGGNVWLQSGTSVRQVTTSGRASQPAWSADGAWIYYIESNEERGRFPARGAVRSYRMDLPSLMRVPSDGDAAPEALATGRITPGEFTWFHWLRQPAPAPDGERIAILSDGPDPTRSNVVVQLFDLASGEFSRPDIPENPPLGHQDPAWRPDGRLLLLVRNGRDGSRGAPTIVRWNPRTGNSSNFTGPGYLSPSWSRDSRWVAATKTSNSGTDVVVIDARNGAEVFRVTDDGRSWSPVWSPLGDSIAFLHEDGGIVDLRLARLGGTAPAWEVTETINLTEVSGLEATSRPGWFIEPADLPALPTAPPSVGPSASGATPASQPPSAAP